FVKCQREIVLLSYERSAKVGAVIVSCEVGTPKFDNRLDGRHLVAHLCVKRAEGGNDPVAEIRLPEEIFLPPEGEIKAKVIGDLSIADADAKLIFRCVKPGPECTVFFRVVVKRCVRIRAVEGKV